jgi:mRNA interferase MazF
MRKLSFGEIVLLKFPYTDSTKFKRRPALVLNDYSDGDILVCRITSQIYNTGNDVYIEKWKESGLKLPSVIRVHKIATLEKDMVEIVMGKIHESIKPEIKAIIANLTE